MDPKHIAFTICSNNYLGQAMTLKDSFLKYNPDFLFFIFLVDTLHPKVDYKKCLPAKVIPVKEIGTIKNLNSLIDAYTIIELNTAIKPSIFKYLKQLHPHSELLYYLDPDLFFYDSLSPLNKVLQNKSIALTPHINSPIPRDGLSPDENTFFRFGLYNLGFLGVNIKHPQSLQMLDWWEERTLNFGFDNPKQGYFVDQLWMEIVPLYYKDVHIVSTYNYNMGPWNLHERNIVSIDGDTIRLNDNTRLVFYHFSKIATNNIDVSREYNRYTLEDFPLLKKLYQEYKQQLNANDFYELKKIPVAFKLKEIPINIKKKQSFVAKVLKKIGKSLISISEKV